MAGARDSRSATDVYLLEGQAGQTLRLALSSGAFDPLVRIGFLFGAAFQIQDDVLNLTPGPDYGKERDGDLYEGKRTLMIIHALGRASAAERQRLVRFLALPRTRRSARHSSSKHGRKLSST